MRTAILIAAALAGLLVGSGLADDGRHRPTYVRVSPLSQQMGPGSAAIGARIDVAAPRPGRSGSASGRTARTSASGVARVPVLYPPLVSTSPILRNPAPLGPGSFWYSDDGGHSCPYLPDSVLPCFRIVTPGGSAVVSPGVNPAGIAASIAMTLALQPGEIHVSPASGGLTGAASWFWLDPAPGTAAVSVTLAGESVTVTAVPEVEWRFGDGTSATGAGLAYRPGPAPAGAVTHVYQARCLPRDRGRNPYVLPSCGGSGYTVEAVVSWRVSYTASGLISASGSLATRTTGASVAYPVSEARAFLVPNGSR
jgi:hypothetical protein